LTIASQKGGAGKTTLSAHLAVEAERAGRGPVAVVDTDPQGSLLDGRRPHRGGHQRRVAVGERDYATMEIRINIVEAITDSYGQNIRTRLHTGSYASSMARTAACLPLLFHPYSASRETTKPEGETMDWKHLLAYITGLSIRTCWYAMSTP